MDDYLSLNEILWRFCPDPNNEGLLQQWQLQENQPYLEEKTRIVVPSCWNRQNSQEFSNYQGVAWYWRTFRTPKLFKSKRTILHFSGILHHATVFIDGDKIGTFHGGFLPFEFNISKYADHKPHFIAVRIEGTPKSKRYFSDKSEKEYYGIFGEIYIRLEKDIILEERSMQTTIEYDESLEHVQNVDLNFSFYLKNLSEEDYQGEIIINISRDYVPVVEIKREIQILKKNSRLSKILVQIDKKNIELWTPEQPNLYNLHVTIENSQGTMIEIDEIIGIREIQLLGDQILLNGKHYTIQGYTFPISVPEFGYRIPRTMIIDRLKELKKMKINTLRPNQGLLSPFIIEMASRFGFLVIEDVPLVSLTSLEQQFFFQGITNQITFQPSLAFYSVNPNENISTPEINRTVLELEKLFTDRLDPTRFFLNQSVTPLNTASWISNDLE